MASWASQLQCTAQGGPFKIAKSGIPTAGPGHVLIRVKVIALNGLDYKQRDYGLMVPEWPYVLGIEAAGTVEAVGSGVDDFRPGDEVAARAYHAYQEYVAVPQTEVCKKPNNVSLEQAASLP